MQKKAEKAIRVCPKCGKSYGTNVRSDGTMRCKLCGFDSREEK